MSSTSYESASSGPSETEFQSPTHVAPPTAVDDFEDDGHHSDTGFSIVNCNCGPIETTSPEMTNSTGDSSYHTYPYVSIRRYASALDLSKPIDINQCDDYKSHTEADSHGYPSHVCNEVLQQYLSNNTNMISTGTNTIPSSSYCQSTGTHSQASSLPSSRRSSTNMTPAHMGSTIHHVHPERVIIRISVKDVETQTDFDNEPCPHCHQQSSNDKTHYDFGTNTEMGSLSFTQLPTKEQQMLLQQAFQHVMMSLQNMNLFGPQYYNYMESNQQVKHGRSISIDNGQVTLKSSQLFQQLQRQQQMLTGQVSNIDTPLIMFNEISGVNPAGNNVHNRFSQPTSQPTLATTNNTQLLTDNWPTSNFTNGTFSVCLFVQ